MALPGNPTGRLQAAAQDLRMSRAQVLVVVASWWVWTVGSMQFYLLPYTQPDVARALGVAQSRVAYANTTSMLSRAVGAVVFGVLSDQFGRRAPLLVGVVLGGAFTLASGFVHTIGQFTATRFLFGACRSPGFDNASGVCMG